MIRTKRPKDTGRQPDTARHDPSQDHGAEVVTQLANDSGLTRGPGSDQWAQLPVTQGWNVPGTLLKVAISGYAMYTQCHPDGTVTERSVHHWDEVWQGNWSLDDGDLSIRVGQFVLHVPAGSTRGTETPHGSPDSLPTDFLVLPVVPWPGSAVANGERVALVKLPPRGTIHAAELLADGGVREYALLSGWGCEQWGGTWSGNQGRLSVQVGGYGWCEELRDTHGFFEGRETHNGKPSSTYPAVCVRLQPEETREALVDAPDRERLFDSHGYGFYAMQNSPKGFFASLLEARKPSIGRGAPQRFAAKCVRRGHGSDAIELREIALREIALAREFSATDGLIAAFESFVLPEGALFGEFAGCTVQIMELGETNLGQFCRGTGPMPQEDVLEIARVLSGALAAMHEKFACVHSDVRHANVIGCRTGSQLSWRLADFNVTTRIDELTGWAPYLGSTPICWSPSMDRRLEGPRKDTRTKASDDVWALGLLLAQCSSGELLPLGKRVTQEIADEMIAHAPGAISQILRRCLTANGIERSSARDVHALAVAGLAKVLIGVS